MTTFNDKTTLENDLKRYKPFLRLIAVKIKQRFNINTLEVDDMLSEALIIFHKNYDKWDSEKCNFRSYIGKITYWRLMDWIRMQYPGGYTLYPCRRLKKLYQTQYSQLDDYSKDFLKRMNPKLRKELNFESCYNPEKEFMKKDLEIIIEKAIQSIKLERHRMVIRMYFYHDMSTQDIADWFEISQSRISQILKRCKTIIKKYIIENDLLIYLEDL